MTLVATNRETTFDLLSSSVRRTIIATLHESGTVARTRLTERLASAEADGGEAARRRMRIALHHNHLPRLEDAGLIDYDDEEVTPTERLGPVARGIAGFDGDERTRIRA